MGEYMQFSAKTKNEAITKACIELGVSSDQLDIQVVSEGSSGFFGIGSKPAIIKACKKEESSEEKEIEKIIDSVKRKSFQREASQRTERKTCKRKNGKSCKGNRDHYRSGRNQRYRRESTCIPERCICFHGSRRSNHHFQIQHNRRLSGS